MNSVSNFFFLLFASAASIAFAQDVEESPSFHTISTSVAVSCASTIDMFLRPLTEAEEDFLGYSIEDAYKMVHKRSDGATLENIKYIGKRGEDTNEGTVGDIPASFLRAVGLGRRFLQSDTTGWIYMGGVNCRWCPDDDALETIAGDIVESSVSHRAWEKILAIIIAAGPYDIFKGVTSCNVKTSTRLEEGSN